MKVIGRSGTDTYIVDISIREMVNVLGFDSTYSKEWDLFVAKHGSGAFHNRHEPKIGTEFKVARASEFFSTLQVKEEQAIKAAGLLRSLADMITNGLPTLIIAPNQPPTEEPKT